MTVAMAGVRVVQAPREIKSFPYFMAWHPRLTNEPAHKWFGINYGWLFGPPEQSRWHRRSLWQAQSLIFSTNSWF
jgi:hypothetical protein